MLRLYLTKNKKGDFLCSFISPTKFTYYPFTLMVFLDLLERYVPFTVCCVCGLFCCFHSSLRWPLLSTVDTLFCWIYVILLHSSVCHLDYILFNLNQNSHFFWVGFIWLSATLCLLPDFATKKTIKNGIFFIWVKAISLGTELVNSLSLRTHSQSMSGCFPAPLFSSFQCS